MSTNSLFENIVFPPNIVNATRLLRELSKEDDLSAVLRGNLYIENAMNRLFEKAVPGSEHLVALLEFQQKCKALRNMGLVTAEQVTCLRSLSELRNRFAHRLDMALEHSDAHKLVSRLNLEHREWISTISADDITARTPGNQVRLAIVCIFIEMELDVLANLQGGIQQKESGP